MPLSSNFAFSAWPPECLPNLIEYLVMSSILSDRLIPINSGVIGS